VARLVLRTEKPGFVGVVCIPPAVLNRPFIDAALVINPRLGRFKRVEHLPDFDLGLRLLLSQRFLFCHGRELLDA